LATSDIWSVGIILFAMVTATLPFDGPSSVQVLKKIVRGSFSMPQTLPRELKDLMTKMLTVSPTQRITIPQIKQHPWYTGLKEDTPRDPEVQEPGSPDVLVFTFQDIKQNSEVISNLRLLGWEESELMNDLLSKDMNMAKVFYHLLTQHKNHPIEPKEDTKPSDKGQKVLRRRSIGGARRVASVTNKDREKRRLSEKNIQD